MNVRVGRGKTTGKRRRIQEGAISVVRCSNRKELGDAKVVVDYRELNKRNKNGKVPPAQTGGIVRSEVWGPSVQCFGSEVWFSPDPGGSRGRSETAFQFERGKYEFTRMTFGLKNAPSTFQRMIDKFLVGLDEKFVQAYMDDLIVFRGDSSSHEVYVRKFMDHVVSKFGTRLDPGKVRPVRNEGTLPASPGSVLRRGRDWCARRASRALTTRVLTVERRSLLRRTPPPRSNGIAATPHPQEGTDVGGPVHGGVDAPPIQFQTNKVGVPVPEREMADQVGKENSVDSAYKEAGGDQMGVNLVPKEPGSSHWTE
ncbi:hypothetical protein AAG570_012479 [Ranatra chinensis]|uniref:Reverse transcriptase domain-containing protein n=1 Tax=Ranatra chinensis TaxID=642074 RepID=A0ABD0YEM5_9HEMI